VFEEVGKGLLLACQKCRISIPGGETAMVREMLRGAGRSEGFDLVGTAVGLVSIDRAIFGQAVVPGDVVLGLASSGLHSNGYSLARRIVLDVLGLGTGDTLPGTGRTVADELLEPTRIYVRAVRALLEAIEVRAMAHITGGGLPGNLPRVLPEGCRARLSRSAWRVPPVFETLREAGRVAEAEMFRTFNMGIGYVVVVAPTVADAAARLLAEAGETVWRVGEIVSGGRAVEFVE
jgi:phosphoribosylformylglycinamidine cyclo-ligase